MNVTEIQKRLDKMPAAMSAKGKRFPAADFRISANEESCVTLRFATFARFCLRGLPGSLAMPTRGEDRERPAGAGGKVAIVFAR